MSVKQTIRKNIEKQVAKYGYSLIKNSHIEYGSLEYQIIINEKHVPLDEDRMENKKHMPLEDGGPEKESASATNQISLAWILPQMAQGSGGHTTIFRAVRYFSELGIHNKIYFYGGNPAVTPEELRQTVLDWFSYDLGDNEIFTDYTSMDYADGVIATSWITAYILRNFDNCKEKFYFVQDFEPWFYPVGTEYALAENTYGFGFTGITAGKWLEQKLHEDYGMETYGFHFAYDRDIYGMAEKNKISTDASSNTVQTSGQSDQGQSDNGQPSIFYYARPYTDRRAFDLGMMTLSILKKRMPQICIHIGGADLQGKEYGFAYEDLGVMTPKKLAEVYATSQLCLVLSMTNISLVPIEVMASGSVVVSNRGKQNEWQLSDRNAILADPDPIALAAAMEDALKNPEKMEKYRAAGKEYADQFTWEEELKKAGEYLIGKINS